MPLQYSHLPCGDKPLNEIVFAGSHDAAITSGAFHIKTQKHTILEQAEFGVRIFDIRITGAKIDGQPGQVELRSFHGDGGRADKVRDVHMGLAAPKANTNVTRMKHGIPGVSGGFGMTLESILVDARTFVSRYPKEFLILKFDKCHNWRLIAEACVYVLGNNWNNLYTGGGNLNNKKLSDVAGKVIVLFTHGGIDTLATDGQGGVPNGIYEIINLHDGGQYNQHHAGLQYYGKGGTSFIPVWNVKSGKARQRGLMQDGEALQTPEVMGMMYWTATGLFEDIKKRDKRLWTDSRKKKLRELWSAGLDQYLQDRMPGLGGPAPQGGGLAVAARQKVFMPNFVMIDFADQERCTAIYDLNLVTPQYLAELQA